MSVDTLSTGSGRTFRAILAPYFTAEVMTLMASAWVQSPCVPVSMGKAQKTRSGRSAPPPSGRPKELRLKGRGDHTGHQDRSRGQSEGMVDEGLCGEMVIPDTAALVRAARDRAAELCSLPADWDGPRGSPISPASAANAVRLVAGVTCPECLPASLSPLTQAKCSSTGRGARDHVEAEVFPDGRLDVLVRVEEVDWEGQLQLDDHDHLGWLGHQVTAWASGASRSRLRLRERR